MMIITKAHNRYGLVSLLVKKLAKLQAKWKGHFADKEKNAAAPDDDAADLIHNHLTNTLGIINLMSQDNFGKGMVEHIATLKSSCDDLVHKLKIPIKDIVPAQPIAGRLPRKPKPKILKRRILFISNKPIQKKIVKGLLINWGYELQILSALPKDLSVLSEWNYDLILISNLQGNQITKVSQSLHLLDQQFLVLSNNLNTTLSKQANYPVLFGPFQPDFLKYKLERMLSKEELQIIS